MKRKRFIKQLMFLGISRNTATAAADAASRAEIPLLDMLMRVRTYLLIWDPDRVWPKHWRKVLDKTLRNQAENVPHRIRPIASRTHRKNGLRVDFAVVDEWTTPGGGQA